MSEWKIQYVQKPLPVPLNPIHGILEVVDPDGRIVKSFEGRPVDAQGRLIPSGVGTSSTDTIQVFENEGPSGLLPKDNRTYPPQTLFSGTREDVEARVHAAQLAKAQMNAKNIGYPI
jgi:hypothetical protein